MSYGPVPRPPLTTRWPILLLTLLAAAIQWWVLDAQSLWYDEGFSIWLAQQSPTDIIARTANDIHPPLYYLLLHGWMILVGSSEWAVRFLSAFFATLCVPLMWQLAHRLLRSTTAAHAAALLTALSPLWLWYAREARMYALLLALLALLGWLWVEVAERPQPRWGWILLFAALATLGVYTHFYLWFVLAAFALAALLGWGRGRPQAALGRWLLAFFVPLVAYLPWLTITLRRLGEDRSYWEGMLPLRPVVEQALGSWMGGHALYEAQATLWGWVGLSLALLGLGVLLWRTARGTLPATRPLLISLWLLLPLVGLYALSWNRPKYHPRYLIFAAPAFVLLLAAWLGWSAQWRGRWLLVPLSAALLLGPFLLADYNTHLNPAFAKADWRGVATQLVQQRSPEEPLLLVSGHAIPVLDYYYPDELAGTEPLLLPDDPTLDTTSVLGLPAVEEVAAAVGGSQTVWLVQWQDEVVDPEGIVPATLRAAGGEPVEGVPLKEISLQRWDLPPDADLDALLDITPRNDNFGDTLTLVGWRTPSEPAPADEGLPIQLFWQAQRPLNSDLHVRATVTDQRGRVVGALDQRPTAYLNPTFRWEPGVTRLAEWMIPLEVATPPGEYELALTVYEAGEEPLDLRGEEGSPRGQTLRIGPMGVAPASDGWRDAPSPASVTIVDLDLGELTLRGTSIPVDAVETEHPLDIMMWWRAEVAAPSGTVQFGWRQDELRITGESLPLGPEAWPSREWRVGEQVAQSVTVRVPPTLQQGEATLLLWRAEGGQSLTEPVEIATLTVAPSEHSFELPVLPASQEVTFGDMIVLRGYDLPATALTPGEPFALRVAWQTLAEMPTSYTAFAHLLDGEGRIVEGAGQDALPSRPTDRWMVSEVVEQIFTLAPPADLPPGKYRIELGWYDASDPTFPRLPAEGEGAVGDHVLLNEIPIVPE